MNKLFFLLATVSLLSGCFGSSGVLPLGQGVYSLTVETPYIVGAAGTKKKAIEEAQAYCMKQGKEVNILQYRGSSPAQNVFDMTFECLAPGEKSNTQVKPSPDAVIEVHNY
jgi:lipoprotein